MAFYFFSSFFTALHMILDGVEAKLFASIKAASWKKQVPTGV